MFIPPDGGDCRNKEHHHEPPFTLHLPRPGPLRHCSSSPAAGHSAAPDRQSTHHAHNPQREAARLSKELNLTADQTAKLEPILADRDQKIAALKNDTTISPMIAKKQMRCDPPADAKQQLATVLTPDQLQQMRALRRHGHGAPDPDPPQTQPQANPQSGSLTHKRQLGPLATEGLNFTSCRSFYPAGMLLTNRIAHPYPPSYSFPRKISVN